MNIFAFIHTPDPTKVKIVKRERNEDEPLLLATTIGHTIPLLLAAPDHAESELEASVDRLFDEGGSGNQAKQGDSTGVGEGANIQPVVEATDTVVEVVAPMLLARVMLNAEVRVTAIPTLPFIKASVSSTLEHSSHHSGPTIAEAEVDSLAKSSVPIMTTITTITSTVNPALVTKKKSIKPSLSSSTSGANPHTGVFLDLTGNDFLVGGIRSIIDPDTDLQKVYVP
ncbi:hypothetical protein Tco_0810712 [Tanacetum coccineum]